MLFWSLLFSVLFEVQFARVQYMGRVLPGDVNTKHPPAGPRPATHRVYRVDALCNGLQRSSRRALALAVTTPAQQVYSVRCANLAVQFVVCQFVVCQFVVCQFVVCQCLSGCFTFFLVYFRLFSDHFYEKFSLYSIFQGVLAYPRSVLSQILREHLQVAARTQSGARG